MADSGRIVIIGAGATGRGQLGQVAYSAGWTVAYIERDQGLVDVNRFDFISVLESD